MSITPAIKAILSETDRKPFLFQKSTPLTKAELTAIKMKNSFSKSYSPADHLYFSYLAFTARDHKDYIAYLRHGLFGYFRREITIESFNKDDMSLIFTIKRAMEVIKHKSVSSDIKTKLNEIILFSAIKSCNTNGFHKNHRNLVVKWFYNSPEYVEKLYNGLTIKPDDDLFEFYYTMSLYAQQKSEEFKKAAEAFLEKYPDFSEAKTIKKRLEGLANEEKE